MNTTLYINYTPIKTKKKGVLNPLYTLHTCSVICQLYLNKAGKNFNKIIFKIIKVFRTLIFLNKFNVKVRGLTSKEHDHKRNLVLSRSWRLTHVFFFVLHVPQTRTITTQQLCDRPSSQAKQLLLCGQALVKIMLRRCGHSKQIRAVEMGLWNRIRNPICLEGPS